MKNINLPSLELYTPQEVNIHYKRPLFDSMVYINRSDITVKYLRLFIKNECIDHKEFFWVLLLNRANKLLAFSEIGIGSNGGVVINHKEIFQLALLTNADAIIVAHNHPSGQLKISEQDKKETKKIKEMSDILKIQLLDHIKITSESFVSLADSNLI